ncbi:MAG: DUF1801 domain-containing protein [Bacteroidetes bacterium]|nr:DUF1801 domain-containing protein [Bacteroidota bacterium]
MEKFETVDAYIAGQPAQWRDKLQEIRRAILQAAPMAAECISYGMPGYKQDGVLMYYAAFKNHVSFFVMPSNKKHFEEELRPYSQTKAAVHLKQDTVVPVDLIQRIVQKQMELNAIKAAKKGRNK